MNALPVLPPGVQVILLDRDDVPIFWCDGVAMYDQAGLRLPCDVWGFLDHAEEYEFHVDGNVDVLGLMQEAGRACAAVHTCEGCGLVCGKQVAS